MMDQLNRKRQTRARVEIDLLNELTTAEQLKKDEPSRKKKIEIRSAKQSVGNIQQRCTEEFAQSRNSGDLQCSNKQNKKEQNKQLLRNNSKADNLSRTSHDTASKRPSKKDEFAYNQLLRRFNEAVRMIGCSNVLTEEEVGELLACLSFVCLEESQEDRELLSELCTLLFRKQENGVLQEDLFFFLGVLCNIQLPEQQSAEQTCSQSTASSHWSAQDEGRKSIRKQFCKLYLNKISCDRSRRLSFELIEPTFQPVILNNSRMMALNKRSKLLQESKSILHSTAHLNPMRASIDVADYLLINRKLSEKKLSQRKKMLEERELNGCTFQPKVNHFDTVKTEESDRRKDRNHHLYERYKPISEICKDKKPTVQRQQEQELKECTFKPALAKYTKFKNHATVRHEDKSVERLKEGYETRLLMKTLKERGYPHHIGNWDKFYRCYKKSTVAHQQGKSSDHKWQPSEKKPILSIDIKLIDRHDSLEVFDGDSIESLTCKLLVKHGLSYDYKDKVAQLIATTLEQNPLLIVFHGFVYEKR